MYGWRGRIGIILPSTNAVAESEFWEIKPKGVSLSVTRIKKSLEDNIDSLRNMVKNVERAAEELSTAKVDLILFACTSGSFLGGVKWENKIVNTIEKVSGIKAITTSGAVVEAIKKLNCRKISIATPYTSDINQRAKEFFESNGLKVLGFSSLETSRDVILRYYGRSDVISFRYLDPWIAYKLAKESFQATSELVFISCTGFRTLEIVETLEEDLSVPVVTSNLASIWMAMRSCGIMEKINGYGKLLNV